MFKGSKEVTDRFTAPSISERGFLCS